MDVVIPFRHSRNNDEELRFVLRSISKHIKEVGQIYVIGDQPRWAWKNLLHIPIKDSGKLPEYHERNIMYKLLRACYEKSISPNFLYHDDDEYLLQTFDGSFYHKGPVWDGNGAYQKTEENTIQVCEIVPFPNNFNVHCPRIFNKNKLRQTLESLDWGKRYGYSINTVYAVQHNIEGICIEDVKFKSCLPWELLLKRYSMNKRFFSVQDGAWKPDMKKLIQSLFPEKSIYEN